MSAALAHDIRFAAFRLLQRQPQGGLSAGQIAARLGVAPGTLSFHLKALAEAGLLKRRSQGGFIYYAPDVQAFDKLVADLRESCSVGRCVSEPQATRSTPAVARSGG